MIKFLKYLLYTFSAVLAILFLLDFTYTYIYQHGNPRNKISYLLSLKNETIDYVFIGSSRVDNNIDANVIESVTGKSAINLGIQGAAVNDYYLVLQLLKEQGIKTKLVFIQVDYVYNLNGNSDILKSALMPHIEKTMVSKYLEETDDNYFYLKYIPFYRYLVYDYRLGFREMFTTLIGKKPNIDFKNGYFPKFGKVPNEFKASLPEQIVDHNKDINKINTFAKLNNMEIIYFFAPMCPATKNLDYAEKLKEKLPKFYDFSSTLRLEEKFFDCIHLNDKGAKEFSKIFGKKINSKIEN